MLEAYRRNVLRIDAGDSDMGGGDGDGAGAAVAREGPRLQLDYSLVCADRPISDISVSGDAMVVSSWSRRTRHGGPGDWIGRCDVLWRNDRCVDTHKHHTFSYHLSLF